MLSASGSVGISPVSSVRIATLSGCSSNTGSSTASIASSSRSAWMSNASSRRLIRCASSPSPCSSVASRISASKVVLRIVFRVSESRFSIPSNSPSTCVMIFFKKSSSSASSPRSCSRIGSDQEGSPAVT